MKNKKGFTLVEILSIIAVLGVIVMLVIPQFSGSINTKKQKEYEKIVNIIENAAKTYHSGKSSAHIIYVSDLVSNNFLTSDLKNPINNSNMTGCVRVLKKDNGIYTYKYSSACGNINVPLEVEPNGGTLAQTFASTYLDGTVLELKDPSRHGYYFSHWEVTKGNSYVENKNKLIIGDTATTIYAMWTSWPKLTINLDGGSTTQSFANTYKTGSVINLSTPTKQNHTFVGWSISSGNGSISGNTFTMGTTNTTLKANWLINNPFDSYKCANGSKGEEPYILEYTGNCEVIDEGNYNWTVRFLTSGTVSTFIDMNVNAFLVGAGGSGKCDVMGAYDTWGCGNGGGGYHKVIDYSISNSSKNTYEIKIGQPNGGSTTAFDTTVNGGGSGRVWGSDWAHGSGGKACYKFEESTGDITYSGTYSVDGTPPANTGMGGNAVSKSYATINGASGVVEIRNDRKPSITLNYDNNGGSGCTSKQVTSNFKYWNLCTPQKEGYYFTGWYTEKEGGTKITEDDIVEYTSDFTLYAHYLNESGYSRLMTSYSCANTTKGSEPYKFTYTGDCEVLDDGDENWRIRLLTDGNLIFDSDIDIQAFLLGAGGSGVCDVMSNYDTWSCGNGGGGYHTVIKHVIEKNTKYTVKIGQPNGGSTTAFGTTIDGGGSGRVTSSDGISGSGGKACYEFEEATGDITYSGTYSVDGTPPANTGMGGNGVSQSYATISGASGIVVVRNARINQVTLNYDNNGGSGCTSKQVRPEFPYKTLCIPEKEGSIFAGWYTSKTGGSNIMETDIVNYTEDFTLYARYFDDTSSLVSSYTCANKSVGSAPYQFLYTGNCEGIDDGNGNWRVRFLSNGTLKILYNMNIDVFAVGAGGWGNKGGNGGGGGYTETVKNIEVNRGTYNIVIGSTSGASSSAFDVIANGGNSDGSGGSGGGGGNGYPGKTSYSVPGWNGSDGGAGAKGQGRTTCEFAELDSNGVCLYSSANGYTDNGYDGYYAGGGAGYCSNSGGTDYCGIAGGKGGGGGNVGYGSGYTSPGASGKENTGGGGGGGGAGGGSGGSGIVIIRNSR